MKRGLLSYLFCLVPLVLFQACDNTIEPFVESGSTNFALHGFLDMRTDQQIVRLEGLRPNILSEPVSLEGVEVSTIDHTDGTVVIWRDSIITLDNGTLGTAFVASFRPNMGHEYSFNVGRNGVTESRATTQVPAPPVLLPAAPVGESENMKQHLVLIGLKDQPTKVHVLYEVSPPNENERQVISVAYGDPGFLSNAGWELEISLGIDRFIILNTLGLDIATQDVRLHNVEMRATLFSEEWQTQGSEFNLENAHGFFGSVGVFDGGWDIDSSAVRTLGFIDNQQRN